MNKFIVVFACLLVAALAEPPVSNGGEAIEGSNYVNEALLRRISDILNGGSSGDLLKVQRNSPPAEPPRQTHNSDPEDSYGPPARSAPQSSYNSPSVNSGPNPKPLGKIMLQAPELAPVVAAFELDGGVESKSNSKSSYGPPRNSY